ncbi:MAG: hypothetical protein GY883_23350 [Shimia sp.]|nr:hypothetical protein [Shimia sp.]
MKLAPTAIVLVTVNLWVSAGNTAESEEPKGAGAVAAEVAMADPLPAPMNGWQSVLDTNRWRGVKFRASYASLVEALSEAHGPELFSRRLDFAEFLIAHMMLPEAQSILNVVAQGDDPVPMRLHAMRDAVALLNGDLPQDPSRSPLFVPQREDRDLWLTLNALATNDSLALSERLPAAFDGLGRQSRPIVQAVLPVFVEAAIALENKDLATAAVPLIDGVPHLSGTSYGQYLYGRYAQLMGNNKTALDAYLAASSGFDRASARARLAMADMALADGGQGALLAARDTLAVSDDAWRGDHFELQVLLRQAEILTRLKEPVDGLLAFGKVMSRFPLTDEAARAMPQAQALLDEVYETGENGQIPIAKWMEIHLMLLPFFEDQPAFSYYNEQLADRAYALGGTFLAANEYQRTLGALQDLVAHDPDNQTYKEAIQRVRLKRIVALRDAGRHSDAMEEIARAEAGGGTGDTARLASLKADVFVARQDYQNLLQTSLEAPNVTQLRAQAKGLMMAQQWEEARQVLDRLRTGHPHAFSVQDAAYLLITAHKTGDKDMVETVGRSFPELTKSEGWVDVAQSMSQAPIAAMPLREDKAEKQLDRLEDVLLSLKDSGL